MKNSRIFPEIKEASKEEVLELQQQVIILQSILETVAVALYHLQDEQEPVQKAVMMSYAVEDAAGLCEQLHEALIDLELKIK